MIGSSVDRTGREPVFEPGEHLPESDGASSQGAAARSGGVYDIS